MSITVDLQILGIPDIHTFDISKFLCDCEVSIDLLQYLHSRNIEKVPLHVMSGLCGTHLPNDLCRNVLNNNF